MARSTLLFCSYAGVKPPAGAAHDLATVYMKRGCEMSEIFASERAIKTKAQNAPPQFNVDAVSHAGTSVKVAHGVRAKYSSAARSNSATVTCGGRPSYWLRQSKISQRSAG